MIESKLLIIFFAYITFAILAFKLLKHYRCKINKIIVSVVILCSLIALHFQALSFYCQIAYLLFFTVLVVGSFIDIQERMLPNALNIILAFLALFYGLLNFILPTYFTQAFIWALVGGGFGFLIALLFYKLGFVLFKKEAFGMGDVKLFFAVGALLGAKSVLPVLLFASIFGVIVYFLKHWFFSNKNSQHSKNTIAFVPYIYLAMFVYMFFKKSIVAYLFT